MCNIFILEPNQMPKKEQVFTCVYNNWHSLGALIRKKDGLEVIHNVPKSGELDPQMVYDLMKDNIEHQRIIHLRHNTAGATDLVNCHPFKVYESKGETIWFMHNGTLHTYKSFKDGKEDAEGLSDSKNFADQILTPIFENSKRVDIHDPLTQKVINKFWAGSNRGVLISSKFDKPWLIDVTANSWKKIKGENDVEFLSANDDYFTVVKRGPELERRDAAKAAEKAQSPGRDVGRLANYVGRSEKNHPFYNLSTSPASILNDWEVYDRETAVGMGFFTVDELKLAQKADPEGFADLAEWIFTDYALLKEEYDELEKKHDKATKMVATLKRGPKLVVDNTGDKNGKEEETSEAEVRVG